MHRKPNVILDLTYNDLHVEISNWLSQKISYLEKKLRYSAKGLSFRELSYACDIDNRKISKIEKGQINITFTTILQLARALEVNPSELLQTKFD